jgi:hypothetical protein
MVVLVIAPNLNSEKPIMLIRSTVRRLCLDMFVYVGPLSMRKRNDPLVLRKRGYPQTYALNYQGKRRHTPSMDIILSDASMKSEGGSFTLSVGDISSVCIRTAAIRAGGLLITNDMVGLHIATIGRGDILLNLVAIQSTVGYSLTVGLQKLTDFLRRTDVSRTPNSILVDRNCKVEIWIDPGLTLVFQPITECYAPVSEG